VKSFRHPSRSRLLRSVSRALILASVVALLPPTPSHAARANDPAFAHELPTPDLPPLAATADPHPLFWLAVLVDEEDLQAWFAVPDPELAGNYHRARWMDPSTGRFMGMDPWEGFISEPTTLHRYSYAAAAPTDNVDPTGEESLPTVTVSAGARVTVASQGVVAVRAFEQAITATLLVAAGLSSAYAVSQVAGPAVEAAREKVKSEVESLTRRLKKARVLFHYSTKENIESIYSSGVVIKGLASGPFPPGAYATDIAGWLGVELMTRTQLIKSIFGRTTPNNYARTAWFVAFAELPKYRFKKRAPFIYHYPGSARIFPLVKSPTLLGD
jgi:RHS repeat-associated protein